MSITREQMTAILAELDADLRKGAAEAEAMLRKAAGDEDESASVESKSSEPTSSPAEGSSPDAGGPPAAAEGSEAPPMGDASAPAPEMGGSPGPDAGGQPSGDPAADGGLTPEALQAEYAQLPPEELDMHIQAALAAKEALQGAAGGPPGMGAGAPPPGPDAGGSPAGAPPGAPPMMGKAALNPAGKSNGGQITKKSEEDLKALIKSQQEDIAILTKAVQTVLEAPVRKSVAALADVQPVKKSETGPMTRKQVDEFIKANASRMTKSDRELWLQYIDNKVSADKLAPMFERLSNK